MLEARLHEVQAGFSVAICLAPMPYTQSNFENCVIGWIVKNFHFCCVPVFFWSGFVCFTPKIWTSEQSNGRQEPLNYHCEGLLVFITSHIIVFYFWVSIDLNLQFICISATHKTCSPETLRSASSKRLLASVHQVFNIFAPRGFSHHRS